MKTSALAGIGALLLGAASSLATDSAASNATVPPAASRSEANRSPAGPLRAPPEGGAHDASRAGASETGLEEARRLAEAGDASGAIARLVRQRESSEAGTFDPESCLLLADLLDRRGATDAALQLLQTVREAPGASEALRSAALDRATLLYRTRNVGGTAPGRAPGRGPGWTPDPQFEAASAAALLRSPRGLAVASDGTLWIADEHGDALVQLDPSGKVLRRVPHEAPHSIAQTPRGVIATSGSRLVGPAGGQPVALPVSGADGTAGASNAVRRLGGIAAGPGGSLLVVDDASSSILRFGSDLSFEAVVARFPAEDLLAAQYDPAGFLWVAFGKSRTVVQFDRSGVELHRAGPFGALRDIAVDGAGNLYVLDGQTRRITVVDRRGATVSDIGLETVGAGEAQPVALAVDASGEIFVADRRQPRILKLR